MKYCLPQGAIIAGLVLVAASCQKSEDKGSSPQLAAAQRPDVSEHSDKEPHASPPNEEPHAHSPTAEPHHAPELSLNQGKKWAANAETTAGVQAMLGLVSAELKAPSPSGELPSKLQSHYQEIFKKCTMTGPAHEQLHRFLIPLGERFEALEHASGEKRNHALERLERHLSNYQNFFE